MLSNLILLIVFLYLTWLGWKESIFELIHVSLVKLFLPFYIVSVIFTQFQRIVFYVHCWELPGFVVVSNLSCVQFFKSTFLWFLLNLMYCITFWNRFLLILLPELDPEIQFCSIKFSIFIRYTSYIRLGGLLGQSGMARFLRLPVIIC